MARQPGDMFVWVWLPGATEPVVAGKLTDRGSIVTFNYGRSYLDRTGAVPLYLPELPLRRGEITPVSGEIAGCLADAGPDSWGRRVIEHRRTGKATDLTTLSYLLESGSDRIGAFDFQESATEYVPRLGDLAPLARLAEAAMRVENGIALTPGLRRALLSGTSVGGARPKVTVTDGRRRIIAKFASVTDTYPVVKAEYVAMELARMAGLDTAQVDLGQAMGKDILLVDRFDRGDAGTRRMMVSALTILELHDAWGMAGRYGAYTDLAHQIRARFTDPDRTLRELFSRITFNVLAGNIDDHPRNHAAFWDGAQLTLTPAYDICPQPRTGGEAAQAMAFGADGDRMSQVARCVRHAAIYHLTTAQARDIVDRQIEVIHSDWDAVCDRASMPRTERDRLWGRQFLNPYALYDY